MFMLVKGRGDAALCEEIHKLKLRHSDPAVGKERLTRPDVVPVDWSSIDAPAMLYCICISHIF
jgi:hypothetical protein